MTTAVDSLRYRVDPGALTAVLLVGDLALIGVFAIAGELSHSVDPVARPWYVFDTYLPFVLGWLGVSGAGGLYSARALGSARRAVALTVAAWIGAAVVAQALRATAVFHGDAALPFFLVSVAIGSVLLIPWRVAVTAIRATE